MIQFFVCIKPLYLHMYTCTCKNIENGRIDIRLRLTVSREHGTENRRPSCAL